MAEAASTLEEEDAAVRADLRAGAAKPQICGERLHAALKRAGEALHAEHMEATRIWRSPLSLFDTRAEAAARDRGLPFWVVDIVLEAQHLGFEAAKLGDLTDQYRAQIDIGKRERRGIARGALLQHLECLDNLTQRLREHLPLLQKARGLFDAPRGTPLPREAAIAAEEARWRNAAPLLDAAPASILEEPTPRGQKLLRDLMRRSERVPKLLESARGAGFKHLLHSLESVGMRRPPWRKEEEPEDDDGLPWKRLSGDPSSWLDVEVSMAERQQRLLAAEERQLSSGAKGRWERCRRRTDRRWSLA